MKHPAHQRGRWLMLAALLFGLTAYGVGIVLVAEFMVPKLVKVSHDVRP